MRSAASCRLASRQQWLHLSFQPPFIVTFLPTTMRSAGSKSQRRGKIYIRYSVTTSVPVAHVHCLGLLNHCSKMSHCSDSQIISEYYIRIRQAKFKFLLHVVSSITFHQTTYLVYHSLARDDDTLTSTTNCMLSSRNLCTIFALSITPNVVDRTRRGHPHIV